MKQSEKQRVDHFMKQNGKQSMGHIMKQQICYIRWSILCVSFCFIKWSILCFFVLHYTSFCNFMGSLLVSCRVYPTVSKTVVGRGRGLSRRVCLGPCAPRDLGWYPSRAETHVPGATLHLATVYIIVLSRYVHPTAGPILCYFEKASTQQIVYVGVLTWTSGGGLLGQTRLAKRQHKL